MIDKQQAQVMLARLEARVKAMAVEPEVRAKSCCWASDRLCWLLGGFCKNMKLICPSASLAPPDASRMLHSANCKVCACCVRSGTLVLE